MFDWWWNLLLLLTTLQWTINHSEVTLEFLAYLRSYHKFPYTTTFKSIQNRKSRKYVSCEIAIVYYFKCYFIKTLNSIVTWLSLGVRRRMYTWTRNTLLRSRKNKIRTAELAVMGSTETSAWISKCCPLLKPRLFYFYATLTIGGKKQTKTNTINRKMTTIWSQLLKLGLTIILSFYWIVITEKLKKNNREKHQ